MSQFDHINVLSLIGVCLDAGPAPLIIMPYMNETPTVRGLAADNNNKLYTETMIFSWNNHYNLNFNVQMYRTG